MRIYEEQQAPRQDLTFDAAAAAFADRGLQLSPVQMENLGLKDSAGTYSNLGLLLSDQNPFTVRMRVFTGEDDDLREERCEITGSLLSQYGQILAFLEKHNGTHTAYTRLQPEIRSDYPEAALEPAILNLLLHRDYELDAPSIIRLFKDRIEFSSPGGVPQQVQLDDVKLGLAVPRSPELVRIFEKLGLSPAYAEGLSAMRQAYKNYTSAPVVEATNHAFRLTLPSVRVESLNMRPSGPAAVRVPEETIMALAHERHIITRREVQQLLGVSQTTSGRLLKQLTEQGRLIQEGHSRNIYYRLAEEAQA